MAKWLTRKGSEFPKAGEAPEGKPKAISFTYLGDCTRCGGAGGYQWWPGFICYQCGNKNPTRQPITVRLFNAEKLERLDAASDRKAERKAQAIAEAGLEFVREHPTETALLTEFAGKSEFIDSLTYQLNTKGYLTEKQLVVIPGAIERIKVREDFEAKADADTPAGQFVGGISERREFSATVRFVFTGESIYGTFYIYTFDTDDGTLVYKGSAAQGTNGDNDQWVPIEKGDRITIKGTIKSHETYKGERQTRINRPVVIEVFAPAAGERE